MSAHHFFAPTVEPDRIRIEGDDARHARAVLRIGAGEAITVSDGAGTVADAVVVDDPLALVARVVGRRVVEPPRPRLTVYPAVPKGGKLDLVVQKLTELGVDEIRPWFAERSIPRWDARKAAANGARWRAVAYQAARQSRRAFLPDVADAAPLGDLPASTVVMHETAPVRFGEALPEASAPAVGLVCGPEGGLSGAEIDGFCNRGYHVACISGTILRAETAAIVGSALVLARYGRMG